jgi:hypothetical protein
MTPPLRNGAFNSESCSQRTAQAQRDGILAQEIVPVQIIGKKGAVSAVRDFPACCQFRIVAP